MAETVTHTDFAPLLLFAAVVGHRWMAGMAHGAAMPGDRVACLQMTALAMFIQAAGTVVAMGQTQHTMPEWLIVVLSGVCYGATATPVTVQRDDIRLFSLTLGHLALYAIVAGMLTTFTTGVVLICALAPSVLATLAGWNRGAGFYYLGETGAPVPRVVESLLWATAASALTLIVFQTYRVIGH